MPILLAALFLALAPAAVLAQRDLQIPPAAPPIDPQQVIGGQNAIDRGYQYQVRPVTPSNPAPSNLSPGVRQYVPAAGYRGRRPARRAGNRRAGPRARATLPQTSIMAPEATPRARR
jgi:hypothetical protein